MGRCRNESTLTRYWSRLLSSGLLTLDKVAVIHSFILEEDGDSGHGFSTKKSDIVNIWKQQHGLNVYKNCASSPDLALIESCWQPVKQRLRKYPHWDDRTTKELIVEGWNESINREFINTRVASMLDRLQAVLDGNGQMTGY